MPVEVRPASFPKDIVRFCKVWWRVYRDDPHWVPPLIFERKTFFHPEKNPYYRHATIQPFIAFRDGEAVGTIAACHDEDFEASMPGHGTFGFFEFVDDAEVARALLEAAMDWLRERGLERITGPYNFSPNHEFGLLVDGFDTDPVVANPHNSAHYPRIYEEIGLVPSMTWYAYWIDYKEEPPRIMKIAERLVKRRPEIQIRPVSKKDWDQELQIVRDVYNDAWHDNYGHVQVRPYEFDHIAKDMKMLVEEDLCYVVTIDGEIAGMSVSFPDLNQVVKKMNGRLLPLGWWPLLTGRKSIDVVRVFILGVKRAYQHLPIGAIMYSRTWEACYARKVRGVEASLILHDNVGMRGAMEKMGAFVYKTYRTFEAPLVEGAPAIERDVGEIIPARPIGFSLTEAGQAELAARPPVGRKGG
jgi:GNAT superfamily N-acetyltransferase